MLKITVLVSGGGTNLQALIDAQNNGILQHGKISQVISSNKDAFAIERAKRAGINFEIADKKTLSENFENVLLTLIKKVNPEIIVLAGFMHILSKNFIENCNAKIINIHPSLIPLFCGKGFYGLKVHEEVLKSGVKITGATVHLVNEIPDGGKILLQKSIEILPDDTPEKLQRRVMENCEWKILPQAVEALCQEISPKIFTQKIKYPGRGIIIGMTESGKIALAYFIMGRSASSRSRIFEKLNDDLIIKLTGQKDRESSLILYSPLRTINQKIIVTNGDQTDTIYNAISENKTFEDALRTREYEPDSPHFTPRISGIIDGNIYKLNILKRDEISEKSEKCVRNFYEYEFEKGFGRLIHTYNNDVNSWEKLPSFNGEPRLVNIPDNIDDFANLLWYNELDKNNKVSLYVRYYDSQMQNYNDRLFNNYA